MRAHKTASAFIIIVAVIVAVIIKCLPLSKERKLSMGYSEDSVLNFTETTAKYGYSSKEHTVLTEDGYILTVFQITKAKNCRREKEPRPVLMMHGVFENAQVFLDAGPSAGLAYLVADACRDVWVGNQRGNDYARKHERLNPESADFWQFSVEEIGLYDVPATMDYILKYTGADKINYIGFSQGCGIYFAMCSERPDRCDRTGVMIALAPAVYLGRLQSAILKFTFQIASRYKGTFEFIGLEEILSKGSFCQELLEYLCQSGWTWTEEFCLTFGFLDNPSKTVTSDTRQLIFSHFPVGTSLKNLVRYEQAIRTGKFQKFDYGEKDNWIQYNSSQAPEYNVKAVSTPVVIIQGKSDNLVHIEDVKLFSTKLPNLVEMVEVADPSWTHFDMLYSQDIKTAVYPKINEYLQIYSDNK